MQDAWPAMQTMWRHASYDVIMGFNGCIGMGFNYHYRCLFLAAMLVREMASEAENKRRWLWGYEMKIIIRFSILVIVYAIGSTIANKLYADNSHGSFLTGYATGLMVMSAAIILRK